MRNSSFLAALTLRERLALLRDNGYPSEDATEASQSGYQRLRLWKAQRAFASAGRFESRLRADGLSEEGLLKLLETGPVTLEPLVEAARPPSWLTQLKRLRVQPARRTLPAPADPGVFPSAAFHPFVAPLVRDAERQLRRRLAALLLCSPQPVIRLEMVLPRLIASLQLRLCQQASRTLVLELHLAKMQGVLAGATPEKRFQSFIARLRRAGTRDAIYQRYPVLARHLAEQARLWRDAVLELLQRLVGDWQDLYPLLPASPEDELAEISLGEGDRHRGGRSVSILRFASGLRVVYKPRSLGVEAHFQDLLRWLNERGDHPPFRKLWVLDRGTHGWMELVTTQPCSSPAELERFYLRQGAYLALLYALEATDVHAENLIAAGEHPVLVDLECLFHPRHEGTRDLDFEMISRSVLRVGLLPRRIGARVGADGIDLSGLGAEAGQLSPQGSPAWADPGTDRMRFVRQPRELPGYQNRPTLDGRTVDLLEFQGTLALGFKSLYNFLLCYRYDLTADRGPLRCFEGDEIRILLRPTWSYAQVLEDSFHPDFLRDSLDRDRFFDALWAAEWNHPEEARVVESERLDLLAGDIPYFASRPASRDLYNSRGERLAEFFPRCALAEVETMLAHLSDIDRNRQVSIIKDSLSTLPAIDDLIPPPVKVHTPPESPVNKETLLRQARVIGGRLADLAFEREGEVNWMSLTSQGNQRHLALEPLGVDLYGGLSGVALFLAYLEATGGEERFQRLARAALRRACQRIDAGTDTLPIGAYTGLSGIVYALTHASVLWNDENLLAKAVHYAERAAAGIESDEALDVLSGAAGCIGALLPLHRLTGSADILEIARCCGDRLLARAEPQQHGIGWSTSISAIPLAGFAHGNAGFAWALSHLAAATQDNRYHACALEALEYERSLFSHEDGNWLDRRFEGMAGADERRFMVAWCHGAPGIGLARLTMPPGSREPAIERDIDIALKTTHEAGFGRNHSLCHGDLGNIEIFLHAEQTHQWKRWRPHRETLAEKLAGDLAANSYLGGIPGGFATPGLMLGLAGTGYGLLRLAAPETVPSILSLEGPR